MKRFLGLFIFPLALWVGCKASPHHYGGFPETISGDVSGFQNAVRVVAISGSTDASTLTVSPSCVTNGPVVTCETTATGATGSATYAIPKNSAGTILAMASGHLAVDAATAAGAGTWECKVVNANGTCLVIQACAATDAWAGLDGRTSYAMSLAMSGCNATVSMSGGAAGTHWAITVQYQSAQ